METAQDIYTITIKQIERFQERMHFEKIQLDQVQNGRQSGGLQVYWHCLFSCATENEVMAAILILSILIKRSHF